MGVVRSCLHYVMTGLVGVSYFSFAQQPSALKFIENKNQWPSEFDYAARVPGGRLFISPNQFLIHLLDEKEINDHHLHYEINESDLQGDEKGPIQGHNLQINFLGGSFDSDPQPFQRSTEYYNFFLGDDSSHWASRAYAWSEVIYPSVYPGIDLRIASVNDNLKYDFIVTAEADPSHIKTEYCGADEVVLDYGNLLIRTTVGNLTEKKPYAYQVIDGIKKEVLCRYILKGNITSFHFPEGYDPCYELIIDPLLIFSTYSGSTADNWGSTATPGENGTVYSSGIANLLNHGGVFPATPGAFQTTYGGIYDIAILKYDSTGSEMLYASYLGGSSNETPHSLVMDATSFDLIVLGTSSSANFPVTSGAYDQSFNGGILLTHTLVIDYPNGSDIVLSRISQHGDQLLSSTFVGGVGNDGLNTPRFAGGPLSRNYGDEMRGDVITDPQGNVFVSSVTASADFPSANSFDTSYNGGGTDAVVMKMNPALSVLEWSLFLGGSDFDASHTLKFDSAYNLFVGGGTRSANFPITTGSYQTVLAGDADGWIAHVSSTGDSLFSSTLTGTPNFDQVYFVDLDAAGSVFVYGQTNGAMPVTPGVYRNANSGQFVQKFSSGLDSLIFSTVFGSGIGMPNISPTAFLVAECNNLYMSGWGGNVNIQTGHWPSNTTNMPTTLDALQRNTSGSDFYFIVLTADATELLYATYLGGNQSRTHVDGGTSRFDKSGIVYHAVCSGCAAFNALGHSTSDFPTTPGAWSRTNNSGNCNNAAFKFDLSSLRARLQTNTLDFSAPGIDRICFPDTLRFQNFSTGGEFYQWDLGDGTQLTKTDTTSFVHQYQEGGIYLVKLKAIDQNTCIGIDSVQKLIVVHENTAQVQDDDDLCFGNPYQLDASGGVSYEWVSDDGEFQSGLNRPTVTPEDTTSYFVTVTDANGCIRKDTVQLNVVPFIELKWQYEFVTNCFSRPSVRLQNHTEMKPEETYFFDFGDGFTSDQPDETHDYEADGDYLVRLVGVREFCVYEQAVEIPVFTLLVPNVITPDDTPGDNDTFAIQYGEASQSPADAGISVQLKVFNRWGRKVFESTDYRNDWSARDLDAGVYFYEVKIGEYATCKSWVHVIK